MAIPVYYARENISYDFIRSARIKGQNEGVGGFLRNLRNTEAYAFTPAMLFSMGGWIKLNETGQPQSIMRKGSSGISGWNLYISKESGIWVMGWQCMRTFTQERYVLPVSPRLDWLQWGFTYNGIFKDYNQVGRIRLYINGDVLNRNEFRTNALNWNNLTADANSRLMLGSDYYVQTIDGYIDNVWYHQDAEYTAEQMAKLYWLREPMVNQEPVVPGLTAFWRFNEEEGQTAFDATGNANDLQLINGVEWSDVVMSHGWTRDTD